MTQAKPLYSVMIVDDDEVDRYLIKRKLKELGFSYHFFEETNGKDALDFFVGCEREKTAPPSGYPPHIVFLDINMPLMNGWEFLREFSGLYSQARLENSVVIMFTSSSTPEDKARAKEYNFVKGYLLKGEFGATDLKQILESLQ